MSPGPDCAAPPAKPRAARERLPARTCDTHLHVLGDPALYPLWPGRGYTPHPCSLAQYGELMRALGVERAVLVQPSVYGTDNRALLDALEAGGPAFRGVVVPSPLVDDETLTRMDNLGVRGFRLNLVNPAVLSVDQAVMLAHRVADRGWHIVRRSISRGAASRRCRRWPGAWPCRS
jgi:predicted TIM-barrel fold metal-dependent hydrolase